jgi:hypothetical protein
MTVRHSSSLQMAATSSALGTFFYYLACVLAIVLLVGIALTLLALAAFSVVKGTDVIYATGYSLAHWSDEQAFPTGAEFCKGLYCRRTDTTQKHVAGSQHRQSETFAYFCPDHQRSDYLVFLDLSHLGTLSWYFYGACVLVTTACWYALATALVSGVVAGPAYLLAGQKTRTQISGFWLGTSVLLGIILAIPSCGLYVWW